MPAWLRLSNTRVLRRACLTGQGGARLAGKVALRVNVKAAVKVCSMMLEKAKVEAASRGSYDRCHASTLH